MSPRWHSDALFGPGKVVFMSSVFIVKPMIPSFLFMSSMCICYFKCVYIIKS